MLHTFIAMIKMTAKLGLVEMRILNKELEEILFISGK